MIPYNEDDFEFEASAVDDSPINIQSKIDKNNMACHDNSLKAISHINTMK
jgi:hypothetical protein